jgi:hypothetical protein
MMFVYAVYQTYHKKNGSQHRRNTPGKIKRKKRHGGLEIKLLRPHVIGLVFVFRIEIGKVLPFGFRLATEKQI